MTSGIKNGSQPMGTAYGVPLGITWSKTWSGQDSPKRERDVSPRYVHIQRGDRVFKIRLRNVRNVRPPKRSLLTENDYSMVYQFSQEEAVGPSGHPAFQGTPVMAWNRYEGYNPNAQNLLDSNKFIKLFGKLREKIQGSDFDASVFLGTANQTLDLIADSAQRIARSLRQLKRGSLIPAWRTLIEGTPRSKARTPKFLPALPRNIGQNWLQMQYGWLPLLGDTQAAAEALAHHVSVPFRFVVRASVEAHRLDDVLTHSFGAGDVFCHYNQYSRASLKAILSEPPSAMAQLGLNAPENLAWELLPWSFVADWFIPIGDFLSARAYAGNLKGQFVLSTKHEFQLGPCHGVPIGESSARYKQVRMDRNAHFVMDVPLPSFKGFDKVASWQHCANAVALLVTGFSGKGR